jgi:hypothetical protein
MLKRLYRSAMTKVRGPIIRWLSMGDLIVVGDILAHPGCSNPLIFLPPGRRVRIYGKVMVSEDNPHSVVPPGWRPPSSL